MSGTSESSLTFHLNLISFRSKTALFPSDFTNQVEAEKIEMIRKPS